MLWELEQFRGKNDIMIIDVSKLNNQQADGAYLNWGTSVKYVFFRWWNADTTSGGSIILND